eukprot:scaffold2596_cov162-Pinguiococcus_pyrenoidosus.AAC.1
MAPFHSQEHAVPLRGDALADVAVAGAVTGHSPSLGRVTTCQTKQHFTRLAMALKLGEALGAATPTLSEAPCPPPTHPYPHTHSAIMVLSGGDHLVCEEA